MKKMNKKSIDSYKKLTEDGTLTKRQAEVLKCLKQELKKATNRMIAKKLGWDINRVTGRVTELREKGLITQAGDFYDTETERTVNLWQ
jgi:DNA-binding MarR family transcriptional regulator